MRKWGFQGDVNLFESKIPASAKKLKHLTLAKGEVTGHHHTITKGNAELYELKGVLYLKVNSKEAELTHQEHSIVKIPQGEWEVKIAKEYDHFEEEARQVRD